MTEKPFYEAENETTCPVTQDVHVWQWDTEIDEYYCDECGVLESNQEAEYGD